MYLLSLLLTAIVLGIVSFLLLQTYFRFWTSTAISLVKFGIPTVYFLLIEPFGRLSSMTAAEIHASIPITNGDDLTYFIWSFRSARRGYGPINTLVTSEGRWYLSRSVLGSHDFYSWWNLFTQSLFGEYYFAPVLANVFVSILTGIYLMKLLAGLGKQEKYYTWFGLFFLLHWDLLAWSSFLNIKGTLAMFAAVMFIYHTIRFDIDFRRGSFVGHHIVAMLGSVILLYYIRYYIGVLLIISAVLWAGTNLRDEKMYYVLLTSAIFSAVLFVMGIIPISRIISNIQSNSQFYMIPYGLMQILTSPRPWGVEPNYIQLVLPATYHWLLLPAALAGAARLALIDKHIRLIIIFATLLFLVYSTTPRFQGPRQRYQLVYVIALAQFEILWYFGQQITFKRIRDSIESGVDVKIKP